MRRYWIYIACPGVQLLGGGSADDVDAMLGQDEEEEDEEQENEQEQEAEQE